LPLVAKAQSLQAEMASAGVNPACMSAGNCSLDDIVKTAAAFGNMLMEISAALFFATFVYGGARYLLSFGKSDWVQKGTQAMKGGAIGMLIVMSAWTIVRFVAGTLMGNV
jgi:hypothetical protein